MPLCIEVMKLVKALFLGSLQTPLLSNYVPKLGACQAL